MAQLTHRKGRCVLTIGTDRRTVSAGRMSRQAAERVRGFVTDLEGCVRSNTAPSRPTAEWLQGIPAKFHAKLAALGLCHSRDDAPKFTAPLDATLKAYIDRRTDVKPGTRTILGRTRASLVGFFGKDCDVAAIGKADAADWHRNVLQTHSQATAHLYGKKARQVFADAVDRGLCRANPFRSLRLGASNNPERMVYVPVTDVQAVIDHTPDREWKLVFALARFGAARIPSEIRQLKWTDIDLHTGRMTLRSPKTEHHAGRASRVVPIAPALATQLSAAMWEAPDGAVYVLPRLRLVTNHTTTGSKLIERAGLTAWVKTFQNLRSSCETDWTNSVPLPAACAFAGNTPSVMLKHYFQVTDSHFTAISGSAAPRAADIPGQYRTSAAPASQNTREIAANAAIGLAPEGPELPPYSKLNPVILQQALSIALRRQSRRLAKGAPPPCVPPAQGSALRARGGAR